MITLTLLALRPFLFTLALNSLQFFILFQLMCCLYNKIIDIELLYVIVHVPFIENNN